MAETAWEGRAYLPASSARRLLAFWNRLRGRPTVKLAATLVAGQGFASVVGAACWLIQSRFVAPAQLGTLQSYAIITGYLSFLNLGSFTALQRELPFLTGQGKTSRASELAAVCQGWTLLAGGASAAVFALLAVWSLCRGNFVAAAGFSVQAVTIFFLLYSGYLTVTYRTSSEFVNLAKTTAKTSVLSIFTLPLLALNPYYGLCLRNAIASCAGGLLLHARRPLPVKPRLEWRDLKGLIGFGLPLAIFGYVETSLWIATQNFLVFATLGAGALGLLAFTIAAMNIMLIVPQAINQIYMPRIAEQLGRCGDLRPVARGCIKPTALSFALSCAAVAIAWFAVEPAFRLLVPKYLSAAPAVRLIMLMMPLMSLRLPQYILIAGRRRRAYAASVLVGFTVGIGSLILVLKAGLGLQGAVCAYLAGYATMIAVSICQVAMAVYGKSVAGSSWTPAPPEPLIASVDTVVQ